MPNYLAPQEFRNAIGDPSDGNSAGVEQAIATASRQVELITGRKFYADTSATSRVFVATDQWWCNVDDISSATSLVVTTDDSKNGTYSTTWAIDVDFKLTPDNAIVGAQAWPYTGLRACGSKSFAMWWSGYMPVRVTAKWGWNGPVPEAVKTAATLLAVNIFKRPEAPWGVAGSDNFGVIRVRKDTQVHELLAPYVHPSKIGVIG